MIKKVTAKTRISAKSKPTVKNKTSVKRRAIESPNKSAEVDRFIAALDHPFKAEVQRIRDIIKGVDPRITEQIKWAAPSFSYKGYLVTFNLRPREHVHLVFHNGAILDDQGLLEGDYPDRRMAYFRDTADVKKKKPALERVVAQWVKVMDR